MTIKKNHARKTLIKSTRADRGFRRSHKIKGLPLPWDFLRGVGAAEAAMRMNRASLTAGEWEKPEYSSAKVAAHTFGLPFSWRLKRP